MHVNRRNSTNSIFQFLGNVHNISSNQSISGGSLLTFNFTWLQAQLPHIGSLLGITSVLWSIHIISVSIPVSRGISAFNYSIHFVALLNLDWINFSIRQDGFTHIHGSFESSGTSVLTFIGGINSTTGALYQRL